MHGGQENFIYNIVENLSNPEFTIDVLTPYHCDNDRFRELIKSKNGKVYELNLDFKPYKSRRFIYKPVEDFLQAGKYDVVHIHSGSISVLAYEALAAKRTGAKKIIVHSHSTGERSLKHSVIKAAFSPLLCFCPTDYLACSREAGAMKYPWIVQKKTKVIRNGIRLNRFIRNEEKRTELRERYGFTEDDYVIGHVGRFTKEKNHVFLIEILKRLVERDQSCRMIFVGDGELLEAIKGLAREQGLRDRVTFTGVVDNPEDYYNIMDYFVLPSEYEGFPFVTLEAQANGLPCIVSTGVPDAVVLTENVKRMELDAVAWADYLIAHKRDGITDNTGILFNKGYDIAESARVIERIYLQ